MRTIDILKSFGGTAIELLVNGATFYSVAWRSTGDIDLYNVYGDKIFSAEMDSTFETCIIKDCNNVSLSFQSSELYHENDGKTEYDLAYDVGTYLANISFN